MTVLVKAERQVLTLADGRTHQELLAAGRQLHLSAARVHHALARLAARHLLVEQVLTVNITIYVHTPKVTPQLLDQSAHLAFGDRPLHTYSRPTVTSAPK
jgi:hypothetical protein